MRERTAEGVAEQSVGAALLDLLHLVGVGRCQFVESGGLRQRRRQLQSDQWAGRWGVVVGPVGQAVSQSLERQRQSTAGVHTEQGGAGARRQWQDALRVAAVETGGQGGRRAGFDDVLDGDPLQARPAQASEQPHGEQGVPADVEEVLVDTDGAAVEQVGHDLGDGLGGVVVGAGSVGRRGRLDRGRGSVLNDRSVLPCGGYSCGGRRPASRQGVQHRTDVGGRISDEGLQHLHQRAVGQVDELRIDQVRAVGQHDAEGVTRR